MENLLLKKDLHYIGREGKRHVGHFIDNLTLEPDIKEILKNKLSQEKNIFYVCYPLLFSQENTDKIIKLNIAGYFYYQYLLLVDHLTDSGSEKNLGFNYLFQLNFYQEESIKILSLLFQNENEFWDFWSLRKNEYFTAFKLDRKFKLNLSLQEFENLADYKSAFGKVAIDSLFLLGKIEKKQYQNLLESHKYFSCGFQLYDDILDLKEDILNNQTNYAFSELLKALPELDIDPLLKDPVNSIKKIYLKGIAGRMLEQAIEYFDVAEGILREDTFPLWIEVIRIKKKEVQGVLMNIDFYVYSLKLKARLSKNKIKCELDFVSKKNAIENSIGLALEFLVKEQEPEGQWKDSPVNTWVSGYWTTGYVLNALQFCFHPKASNIKKDKAIEYLENKNTSVWGYVKEWIEDADSTNFALLGLLANQIDVRKEVDNLLTFQMADGGVTTYNNHSELLKHLNDPNIKNVKGWTQSHVCVSVGTLLVLGKLNGYENIKEQLIKYLLENKVTDCLWASHWWTSPIYSTSLIIEASLHYNHPELNKAVSNSLEKLVSLQGPNGCYSDEFNEAHPFYTALVLNALCSDKKYFKQYEKEVTFMASWMLRNQNEDGSWDSSYALRVPAANVLDSSEIKNWKKSDLGENVIIEDIHRIITTSTAISALSRYEKCQN